MKYDANFRCYYANGNYTDHHRMIELEQIGKWIDAYIFTHPEVESITVKIWRHTSPPNGGEMEAN